MIKHLFGLLVCFLVSLVAAPAPAQGPSDDRFGHPRSLDLYGGGAIDGLPWQPPSRERPLGTVLVGYAQRERGPRLVEWDLAHATAVRSVVIPAGNKRLGLALARAGAGAGAGLVAVASAPDSAATLTLLSPSLRPTRSRSLGLADNPAVTADERHLFVAWLGADHSSVVLASLDPRTGDELARRVLPLPAPATLVAAQRVGELALARGRLWLSTPLASGQLFSLSLDLQELTSASLAEPRLAVLPAGDTPLLLRRVGSELIAQRLGPDLSISEQTALGDDAPLGQLLGAHDPALGLALGDGRVFSPGGAERRVFRAPFDAARVFWAHGKLVELAFDDKGTGAYVLWGE